jgi:hypothetical protein
MRLRVPRLLAQPRTPFAFAAAAVAVLLALVALTPQGIAALPPGFTRQALASSERGQHASAVLPDHDPLGTRHALLERDHDELLARPPLLPDHADHERRLATQPGTTCAALHRPRPIPRSGPILAVGDSVMLGASAELEAGARARSCTSTPSSRASPSRRSPACSPIAPRARCHAA